VGGDYEGLRLYASSLCAAFAGTCLVPGSYTRNCSSYASQPVTEKLNVVALHSQAQHLASLVRATDLAEGGVFVAGGNESVLFSSTQNLVWRKEYAGGIVDGTVCSAASVGSSFLIGTNDSFSFSTNDGTFQRVGAYDATPDVRVSVPDNCGRYEGLSMNNVTSLASLCTSEGTQIFAGTGAGVVVAPFLLSQPQAPVDHRYFSGPRWLAAHSADPDENSVLHLAAFDGKGWSKGLMGGGGGVWAATRQGLSLLEALPMTLSTKSDYLQVHLHSSFCVNHYCSSSIIAASSASPPSPFHRLC
jgi:hypothetical protein